MGENDVCRPDNNGSTPLIVSAVYGHVTCIEILVREIKSQELSNLNLNITLSNHIRTLGSQKVSAFFISCYQGFLDIAKMLLDAGADINTTNETEDTPLHVACTVGQLATVKFLVEKGANISLLNKKGFTAYELAQEHERTDLVRYLDRLQVSVLAPSK